MTEILTNTKKIKIGNVELKNPVFTAPMAGITDRAFRELLHDAGAGLVYTEMLSDMALSYGNERTFDMLDIEGEVAPIAVQLCGSSIEHMPKAAKIIEDYTKQFDNVVILDINMGCPAPKIVKNQSGSKLMTTPDKAKAILEKVVAAVDMPVTAKMRLGWDDDTKNVLELAKSLEEVGAAAITIHGRTREQFYSGTADWTLIDEASRMLKIPVIGNGDVSSVDVAKMRMAETNCSALVVGRAMMGNPWLIRDLVCHFEGGKIPDAPRVSEVIATAIKHLKRQVELSGEHMGVRVMRSHIPWYLKGFKGAAQMRNTINKLDKVADIEVTLLQYQQDLESGKDFR